MAVPTPHDKLCYIIGICGDETPMPVGLELALMPRPKSRGRTAPQGPLSLEDGVTKLRVQAGSNRIKSVSKLLESDDTWGMLLRTPAGDLVSITGSNKS